MGSAKGSYSMPPAYSPPTDTSEEFKNTLEQYQANTVAALETNKSEFATQLSALEDSNSEFVAGLPSILGADQADIDWEAKAAELKKKMEAGYASDQAKRKGRLSTLLTSPLLSEDDPLTTNSILTGR